ncbi:hypothetical protein GCM10011428_32510 [Streptomyces violaceus]
MSDSSGHPQAVLALCQGMSLTGTPFLCTLVVLSVVALALPLVLWSRLRGPRVLRAAARTLMLLFAQGTAVALVFTLVNNANSLYDTWGRPARHRRPCATGGRSGRRRHRRPRPGAAPRGAPELRAGHRARYRLSGYNDPIGERDSLGAQSPALRAENNPCVLLREASAPPRIAFYLSGQPHDGYEAAVALEQAAKAPTSVHVVFVPRSAGGHTSWRCGGRRWSRRSAG